MNFRNLTETVRQPLKVAAALFVATGAFGPWASAQTMPRVVSVDLCNTVGMRPTDQAGAGARVGNWNNLHGLQAKMTVTLTDVVDQTEKRIPSLTIAMTGGSSAFGLNTYDTPKAKTDSNDARMYDGVFDQDNGQATTLTVTGIPFAHYDVYFYRSDDGAQRAGKFTVGASSLFIRGGKGDPSAGGQGYIRSKDTVPGSGQGNYVEFENLTGRTLTASFTAVNAEDKVQRCKIAGFQIVERK